MHLAEASVAAGVLARAGVFGVGGGVLRAAVLQPLDARGDEGAGDGLARLGVALAGGGELHAHGLDLLLRVELRLVGHALGVQRVAEGAEAFQPDALALRHVVGHDAGQFGQHGHDVGIADGGDARQAVGDLTGFDGLSHHYGQGVVHPGLLIVHLLVVSHDVTFFCRSRLRASLARPPGLFGASSEPLWRGRG